VLLAIVFVMELSAGLAGYVLKDGLQEYLVSRVSSSMAYYSTDPEIARTVDFMQKKVSYRNI
jgi:DNA-binding NarL/FixJ family response regulator